MSRPPKKIEITGADFLRLNPKMQKLMDAEQALVDARKSVSDAGNEMFAESESITGISRTSGWGISPHRRDEGVIEMIEPHCQSCGVVHDPHELAEVHAMKIVDVTIGPNGITVHDHNEKPPTKH